VAANVAAGAVVSGSPAFPHREWVKASLALRKLPELRHKVQELERRLAALESGAGKSSEADVEEAQ
jgi:UDP-3-O-[3-hydroxymyristoyl] glucosamine N-acyltransferase